MGIKESRVYVSDRGDTFDLGDMTSSHILNVLVHHGRQLDVLYRLRDSQPNDLPPSAFLDKRVYNMETTIGFLERELKSRDPENDERMRAIESFDRGTY